MSGARPLPQATEVEQELLGEVMRSADSLLEAVGLVAARDFFDPLHERLWEYLSECVAEGRRVTPSVVAEAFSADAALGELGGTDYLFNLADAPPSQVDVATWCATIVDRARRRDVIECGERMVRDARDATGSPEVTRPIIEIVAEYEGELRSVIIGSAQPDDPRTLYDAAKVVVERLDAPKQFKRPMVPFGVAGLDAEYGGMTAGDVTIIAGRTGTGKTALAVAIADKAAAPDLENLRGYGVFMTSLEMKQDQIAERWLSMRAFDRHVKVPYGLIRLDRVHDEGRGVLAEEAAAIGQLPFWIDHKRAQTVSEIGMRARRAQAMLRREGVPLRLLVIDHLQRIKAEGTYRGNKTAEVSETVRAIKDLAGQLDVAIICLSQLNRAVEGREDKSPQLSDLRESGSIEEEADSVLLLYRPEYYARKGEPDKSLKPNEHLKWLEVLEHSKGHIFIDVAKARHGKETKIKAKCEIAYNWIGDRM